MTVFHKTEPWWFDQAKDLAPGGSKRLGDSQKLSYNGRSYFLWDFRDKEGEVYEPIRSLAEKLKAMKSVALATTEARCTTELPEPAMRHPQDWPSAARVWLHRAHLTNEDIAYVGAYWNPRLERVVVPFRAFGGEKSWIARSVSGNSPKYLLPVNQPKGGLAFIPDEDYEVPTAILCEDLLSAYRVSRACSMDAYSVLGTSLSRAAKSSLARHYVKVYVWMDPDKAGRDAQSRMAQDLGMLDLEVVRVTSSKDPKLLHDEEIRECIREAECQS